jgi:uncharacterized glyoxalase superfamily protein PhnB
MVRPPPSLRARADLAERGVEIVQPAEEQPWGGTMALIKDSEGNTLVLHD